MDAGSTPLLTPLQMTDTAIEAATGKATSRPLKSFLLALTAGTFIGVGFIFYLVSQAGADKMPAGMAKVVGGLVFTTGLAMVVLTGAELFTSSTLTLTARATGRITWGQLLRNWLVVYVGNFLGSLALVVLYFLGASWQSGKGAVGVVALTAADAKTSHTFVQTLCLGILCNLMVCMAVWITYAGRTVVDKVVGLTLPIAMFVASGFEHSVANMFLLPFAMAVKTWAPASFWAQSGVTAAQYGHLGWGSIFTANLLPVTLGNIIGGGLMVGLFYVLVHKVVGAPGK